MACLNLDMYTNKSTCTLTFKDTYPAVKPISPVPVYLVDDCISVPNKICVKNGPYHFSTFDNQSFHDNDCTIQHDPRIHCNTSNSSFYTHVPGPPTSSICHKSLDEQVSVCSNHCACLCKHTNTMLPGLDGVLEHVSTNNSKQDESQSRPGCTSKLSIQSNPRVSDVCSARPSNMEFTVDDPILINYVELKPSDPPDISIPAQTDDSVSPNLNIHLVNNIPDDITVLSRIIFITDGPDFLCILSDGYSCPCTPLKLKNNVKFGYFNSKVLNICVAKGKNAIKTIFFSLPDRVRICDTQKIALLIKLLLKFGTSNILWDVIGHGSHPSLHPFLEDLKLGFSRVLVASPVDFNLFLLDSDPGGPISTPPPPPPP